LQETSCLVQLNIAVGMRAAQGARALGAGAGMQAATAGAAQGAVQPLTEPSAFGEEKAAQVGFGAIGGKVGEAVSAGLGRVLNPLASKAEQTMRELGITPTPGQPSVALLRRQRTLLRIFPLLASRFVALERKYCLISTKA